VSVLIWFHCRASVLLSKSYFSFMSLCTQYIGVSRIFFDFNIGLLCMIRDQLNSRFHGRDIFREIDLLPRKTLISVKSVIFREF